MQIIEEMFLLIASLFSVSDINICFVQNIISAFVLFFHQKKVFTINCLNKLFLKKVDNTKNYITSYYYKYKT